jgi:hypothetical protein
MTNKRKEKEKREQEEKFVVVPWLTRRTESAKVRS